MRVKAGEKAEAAEMTARRRVIRRFMVDRWMFALVITVTGGNWFGYQCDARL